MEEFHQQLTEAIDAGEYVPAQQYGRSPDMSLFWL
jgi:hypothetical protein